MLPFTLMSMARSGGHYVRGLINSHPAVSCQGEWLNDSADDVWEPKHDVVALGVKTDHWDAGRLPIILPALIGWGFKFVILERANQFEVARSFAQVQQGGWWRAREGQEPPKRKNVHLDVDGVWKQWRDADVWRERLKADIPADRVVWLRYEDVLADPQGALLPVWELLGVEPILAPESPFLRLESRPLSETVCNYGELVKAFTGTDYEQYL